jgi:sugar (pentulose or hexulose) kinase
VTGFTVAVPAVLETAVLGSAILGATGASGRTTTSRRPSASMTRIDTRIEPRADLAGTYDRLFEAYLGSTRRPRRSSAAARAGRMTRRRAGRGSTSRVLSFAFPHA